jgi:hypothetical protein
VNDKNKNKNEKLDVLYFIKLIAQRVRGEGQKTTKPPPAQTDIVVAVWHIINLFSRG